ncbi:MAG TPA: hypothetical protein VF573_28690 [Paraburkholderia sp.]|uniref:hypothetical protein n=1 Tax=Paraburkholderia sp. TaxID=1926495 RepID=UPI002ED0A604
MNAIAFTLLGKPASKANSRELVTLRYRDVDTGELRRRPRLRKSDKALAFERSALKQIPSHCRVRLTGPVCVTLRIFYATERPDLDESVILDVLQDRYPAPFVYPAGAARLELRRQLKPDRPSRGRESTQYPHRPRRLAHSGQQDP